MRLRGRLATHDFAQGAIVGNASAELRRSSAGWSCSPHNCLAALRRLGYVVKDATGQALSYVYAREFEG